LSLALAEILPAGVHLCVQGPIVGGADALEDVGAGSVAVFLQWVEVLAHCAREEDGVLGEERLGRYVSQSSRQVYDHLTEEAASPILDDEAHHAITQSLRVHFRNVDAVNEDAAGFWSDWKRVIEG